MAPSVTNLLMESVNACRKNSEKLALAEVAKYNAEEAKRLKEESDRKIAKAEEERKKAEDDLLKE